MMIAEMVLSAILFIGALLHVYGSFVTFDWVSPELVWSIGSSGLAMLLAALAVLRSRRPTDRALSSIVLSGCVGWAAIVLAFGIVIGNPARSARALSPCGQPRACRLRLARSVSCEPAIASRVEN